MINLFQTSVNSVDSGPFYAKQLSQHWQFQQYKDRFENLSPNASIEHDLLGSAYVFGYYSGPFLVGGIVISCVDLLHRVRLLEVIPENLRPTALDAADLKLEDIIETGCLWFDPTLGWFRRIEFLALLTEKLVELAKQWGKKTVLAGSYEKKIRRFQKKVFRHMIYLGASATNGRWVELYATSVSSFRIRAIIAIISRLKRSPKRIRRRTPALST